MHLKLHLQCWDRPLKTFQLYVLDRDGPVTQETVAFASGLPWIADVAKPMKAADFETSKEGRASRVSEPSELFLELHSATRIPFRACCSARVATPAKEATSCCLPSGSSETTQQGEKTVPYLCMVDHVFDAVCAVLMSEASSEYVIRAVVASAGTGARRIILKSDGEPHRKSFQWRFRNARSVATILQNRPVASHGSNGVV